MKTKNLDYLPIPDAIYFYADLGIHNSNRDSLCDILSFDSNCFVKDETMFYEDSTKFNKAFETNYEKIG